MPQRIKTLITYLITFGLCGFLLWFSVKDLSHEDIAHIRSAIAKANFIYLIPIVAMGVLSHLSRAVRWKYLMEPLGYKPKLGNIMFAIMIGYFANLGLPRFGEVLKCTILARYEKIPADKLVGTIITERAFDVVCLLILFLITFLIQIQFSMDYLHSLMQKMQKGESDHTLMYVILSVMALAIILLILFRKRLNQISFFQKIKAVVVNIWSGVMSFKTMKNKPGFLFHTVFIWCMYGGMILIGFQCLTATQGLGLPPSFSVLSFGSVGMIATPGGIGAYTLIVNEIVQLYGIDKINSNAISWIIWLVPTVILILGGIISLILFPLYNRNNAQ